MITNINDTKQAAGLRTCIYSFRFPLLRHSSCAALGVYCRRGILNLAGGLISSHCKHGSLDSTSFLTSS